QREIELREQLVAGQPARAEIEQRVREEREQLVGGGERVRVSERDAVLDQRERQGPEAVALQADVERSEREWPRALIAGVHRQLEVCGERQRIGARVGLPAREREHVSIASGESLRHRRVARECDVDISLEWSAREERAALEAGFARRTAQR